MKGRMPNKKEKYYIKIWLKLSNAEKDYACPFFDSPVYPSCNFCLSWFPRRKVLKCPCLNYTLKYVIKRAKQMLEDDK